MRFLAALCLALCSGLGAFAQCHAPRYQAGATFVDSTSVLVRSISIPLQDFSPSKLVCLATRLRERYRERSNILVNIFSSRKAAWTGITVQEYDEKLWRTFAQMHARYSLDADKHEEYIEILPLGVVPSWPQRARPYSTRIDFPVATAPRCRLEINSRCLVALADLDYPRKELKKKASGTVTLAGTITCGGELTRVRVVKAEIHPTGENNPLVNAAVQNLSSWRVEAGPHREAIRVTYSYVIDNSLPDTDPTQVQWALPNEVTIKGSPPE